MRSTKIQIHKPKEWVTGNWYFWAELKNEPHREVLFRHSKLFHKEYPNWTLNGTRWCFIYNAINIHNGVTQMATKQKATPVETNDEIAEVDLTLEQALHMRYDEVVGPAIEEGLDNDPFFYRPFKDKSDAELQFEAEKCDAACVTAALKNEKPDPKIDGARRDINRERKIRSGEIDPAKFPPAP